MKRRAARRRRRRCPRRRGHPPRAAAVDRRGRPRNLPREGVVDVPVRRGDATSSCSRRSPGRGRSRSSGGATRRAPASPAGCSPRRQPMVVEDVGRGDRAGPREIAESTGYVPPGVMAVPRLHARAHARRAGGARSAERSSVHARRDGAASACSPARRRSRSTCSSVRGARRTRSATGATSLCSRAWRRSSGEGREEAGNAFAFLAALEKLL